MEENTIIAEEETVQEIPVDLVDGESMIDNVADGDNGNTESSVPSGDTDNISSGEPLATPDSQENADLTQNPEESNTELDNPESSEPDVTVPSIDPVVLDDILKTLNRIDACSKEIQKLYQETVEKQDIAIHNIQLISTVINLGIFTVIGVLLALILAVFYSKHR